jgi:hypothetical protein
MFSPPFFPGGRVISPFSVALHGRTENLPTEIEKFLKKFSGKQNAPVCKAQIDANGFVSSI